MDFGEIVRLLAAPFAAALVLTGIHAYLGVHIIERGVIFVDLALAQVAALGTTIAFLLGHDLHGPMAYVSGLGATLLVSLFFAATRTGKDKVPQEAIIGIFYAVSAAAMILVMDKAPEGAEHIKHLLVGNILVVSWSTIAKTFLLYLGIGAIHFIFRKRFFLLSRNPLKAKEQGISIFWWDFLFYALFGLVVTSSVSIGGVLLVFSYLIVPSVISILFFDRVSARLVSGWGVGILASVMGVLASYFLDLPTGAAIIVAFGALLGLAAGAKRFLVS